MKKFLPFLFVLVFAIFLFACKGDEVKEIGISISSNPTKTVYYEGERFDSSGLVVVLKYSDGTSEAVTGYTIDKNVLSAGDKEVKVTYHGFTAKIPITVHSAVSLSVTTPPTKVVYLEGDEFDPTGMVVKLVYADGTAREVTGYTVDKDILSTDDEEVTVTYGNFSAKVNITVHGPSSLKIATPPTKTTYIAGDEFDPTGMVVKVVYSDGTEREVTGYTVDKTTLSAGDSEVTVTYGNLTAKVQVTVKGLARIYIMTPPTKSEYSEGEEFDPTGMVVKLVYSDDTEEEITDYQIDKVTLTINDREVKISYQGLEATVAVKVKTADGYEVIFTAQELLDLLKQSTLSGKYRLGADIDCQDVDWVDPKATLTGTFDGDGHTIKNITHTFTANKHGALFYIIQGGTVKNLRLDSIALTSSFESLGLIAGLCREGADFENIEIVNCSLSTSNHYVGLLFARSDNAPVTVNVNMVTVKNNVTLHAKKYGAGLLGDLLSGSVLNVKNVDFSASLDVPDGQGGMLSGRDRGNTTQNFENIRIRGTLTGGNKLGLFSDGTESGSTITLKNVLVLGVTIESTSTSQVDPWKGGGTSVPTLTNCYFVEGKVYMNLGGREYTSIANYVDPNGNETPNGSTGIAESNLTLAFYRDTLKFDFENAWEEDGSDIKLIGSTSNQIGDEDVLVSISAVTTQVKTFYISGEEFTSAGLVVRGVFSNGVETNLESDQYTVDASAFNTNEAGEYIIKIKCGDLETTYTVVVVKAVGIKVYDEFAVKTYLVGGKLNTSGIYVYAVMTDGSEILIEDYTLTNNFNGSAAGVYQVTISYGNFTPYTYDVTVVEKKADIVDNKVEIVVDQSHTGTDGTFIDGKPVFKTMTAMIDYLNACNYSGSVLKIVYVRAGEYVEKITFGSNLKNVILIGDSKETTILSYYVCGDHKQPNGSIWGTQGSASVSIKGEGFQAMNITFKNTYDYFNSTHSNKQAVAAYIEADKVVFYNCAFYGVQDTLYAKWGRQYYKDCYIEGSVDFIFGNNAPAVFENCTIHTVSRNDSKNNGYITAHKGKHNGNDKGEFGYVFLNCKLTADENVPAGTVALGRPWDADATVAYLYCEMGAHISKLPYGDSAGMDRYEIMSGNSPVNADFKEYGNTGPGAITEEVLGMKLLTEEQAARYTLANIFAATNGQITWSEDWDAAATLNALKALD